MEKESLKYLLGSALRGGVSGNEGDSGGGGGISPGKAAGPTQELWWGQAPCHTGISSLILHRGPEEGQAQTGCGTCPTSASQASCLLNFRTVEGDSLRDALLLRGAHVPLPRPRVSQSGSSIHDKTTEAQ